MAKTSGRTMADLRHLIKRYGDEVDRLPEGPTRDLAFQLLVRYENELIARAEGHAG